MQVKIIPGEYLYYKSNRLGITWLLYNSYVLIQKLKDFDATDHDHEVALVFIPEL